MDNRDCDSSWFSSDDSNTMRDGKFDYIALIKKKNTYAGAVPLGSFLPETGHWQYSDRSKRELMQTFIHEFAHNMYNAAHVAGSNTVFQNHFQLQSGWGMTALPYDHFFLPRANEMWVNGWLRDNPQDPANNDIVTVNINNINTHTSGIELGDLLSTRKAVRIEIPNSNPNPNGVNHYLWIENHQKKHPFDEERIDFNENKDTEPGLYMYVTSELNDLYSPISVSQSGNNVHTIHPAGKKDYEINAAGDNLNEIEDNPISGLPANSLFRMNDPNHPSNTSTSIFHCDFWNDGKCSGNKSEYLTAIIGGKNNPVHITYYSGSSFIEGDELSINGIFPVLNYPTYHPNDTQDPYILSGLKVAIDNVSTNGDEGNVYTINVSYDDWEFKSDKRWCGDIIVPTTNTLTVTNTANLDLALSSIANRSAKQKERGDNVVQNFVAPTTLIAQTNSSIIIENNSCINVKEESTLKINENATLHLKSGGFVHIKDEDSKLVLDENSILHMEQNAEIIVRDGGSLVINTDNIDLDFATSKIIIESGGILTTTTTGQAFNFDGPGQLVIEEGAIIDMPFNFVGESSNHTAIFFNHNNSTSEYALIDMEHDFYLTDCRVWHNGGSKIIINDSKVKFDNVNFIDGNGSSTAFVGNNLRSFDCKDSKFDDFDVGIILNDYTAPTGNPNDPCNNPSNPIFKVRNCEFNYTTNTGVSCTNVYKLYAANNIFNNDVLGNVNQKAIYCTNSGAEVINNEIDKFYTGVHFNGANSNSTLQLSSGDISYCNTAIRTELANATIKYCAKIHHNFYGIHSTASGIKQITIGRKGGTSITDNEVGIKGYNIIVDIDAISAKSANGGVHHPNDLSNNNLFFDLSYSPNVTLPTGLSARGNYWGWYNGCGAGADETGAYLLPFPLDDSQWLYYQPTTNCLNTGLICNGAAEPNSNGNITGFNTNFNLIYNISNDYLEEEAYNYAHFGFSLVADFEDEPIYNSLELNDQNTVILSKVQQTTIEPYLPPADACRVGENPGLMFPDVSLFSLESEAYELIESVSPNPFNNYITLSTFIKSDAYVIEIFNAYDINGRSLMQLKTENNKLKIDVSNLKPGIYAIKVTDKKGNTDYAEILKAY